MTINQTTEIWYKLGDFLDNPPYYNLLREGLSNIMPSEYYDVYAVILMDALDNMYRYRYLYINSWQQWYKQYLYICNMNRLQLRLLIDGFEQITADFIKGNLNIEGTTQTTADNNSSTTTNNTGTSTLAREGTDTTTNTEMYTDQNVRTGSEKTQGSNLDTINSTVTGIDNTVVTNDRTNTVDETGVKLTTEAPAANVVTKSITTNLIPPQSATDLLQNKTTSGITGIRADNMGDNTPVEVSTQYASSISENITFSALDREEDGDYKLNVTTETWGVDNPDGSVQPRKTQTTENNTQTTGRATGSQFNTENTQSGTNDSKGESTTTYNNVTDTRTIENLGDSTHNIKFTRGTKDITTRNLSDVTTTTGKNTGNIITSQMGYNVDRSALAKAFYELINDYDVFMWFIKKFEPIFADSYVLDDRDVFSFLTVSQLPANPNDLD